MALIGSVSVVWEHCVLISKVSVKGYSQEEQYQYVFFDTDVLCETYGVWGHPFTRLRKRVILADWMQSLFH